MLALLPLVVLLAALAADDPCGVAGLYELDRDAVHAHVVEDMDEALADLEAEPETGTLAHTVWQAQRDAFRGVRAQAARGDMVPPIATRLDADGTAMQATHAPGAAPDWSDAETGRWTADAACEAVRIDFGSYESTLLLDGGRLFIRPELGGGREGRRVELLRAR